MIIIISLINCSVDVQSISLLVAFLANIEIATCGSRISTMVPAHLSPCQRHSKTTPGDRCYHDSCNISCIAEALPRVERTANCQICQICRDAHHVTWQLGAGVPGCSVIHGAHTASHHSHQYTIPWWPKSLLSSETETP